MPRYKEPIDEPGTWIFRDIPRDLMRKVKAIAAIQGKSVKGIVIELVVKDVEEFERKGGFPKSK